MSGAMNQDEFKRSKFQVDGTSPKDVGTEHQVSSCLVFI